MNHSSLQVFDDFFGEPVNEEHVARLETAPEEHVIDLFLRLNEGWVEWFSGRFDKDLPPDKHYFLGESLREVEPMPFEKYKQLAMYFPTIAAADPVEACIGPHIQAAQVVQNILPEPVRAGMVRGLRRLVQISPLVRAGAIDLVPTIQVRLSEGFKRLLGANLKLLEAPPRNGIPRWTPSPLQRVCAVWQRTGRWHRPMRFGSDCTQEDLH